MGLLSPDVILNSISDLTIEFIYNRGIKGIILDADNTILAYKSTSLDETILNRINELKNYGIKIVLVSNNFSKRVSLISRQTDIPNLSMALKPTPFKLNKAVKIMGLSKGQVLAVGDQMFTDVLGAHLAGIKVALVPPLSKHDSFITRILRKLEKSILKRQEKRSKDK